MKTRVTRALAVVGLGAGCACGQLPPVQAPASTLDVEESTKVEPEAASDSRIMRVLIRELDRDRVVGREHIRVNVDLGVTSLEGHVASRLAKDRAVEIAGVVKGIRAIIDRIAVTPRERPDRELEFVVAGTLSNDPVTASQSIAARALDDVVYLSGDVDSMGTRRIAERDVLSIPGVVEVIDDLALRPQRILDESLAAAVARIVRDDPWLDSSSLQVSARRGAVALAGRVASGAERARAENDALQASPASVDVSALQIDTVFNDDGTLRETAAFASTDLDITRALRDAYVLDPRVNPFAPTVEVRDRVVVLTGVAPTRAALRAAEEDALHVPGVANVRDDLKERRSVIEEDDGALRSEVLATMARDPQLNLLHIAVQVQRGRVFLRGTVPTETARARAVALASSAPGTLDVDDGLAVALTGLASDAQPF